MILFNNGLVIQARIDTTQFDVPAEFRQTPEFLRYQSYQGIARYVSWPLAWPLHVEQDLTTKELTTEAEQTWFQRYDLDVVPDQEYCVRYFRACRDRGITTRTLFCRTERQLPTWQAPIPESAFLGYDYSTSQLFYSVIPDDLLVDDLSPLLAESRARLNSNRLFDNEADVHDYIEQRETAIKSGEPLEPDGDFLVYHLSEVNGASLVPTPAG
ncbi:MAG: hypothetical protein HY673_03215 [Chloroflexi bacterium]|nr:hypothetical protein [Chloroflexota bacterium]